MVVKPPVAAELWHQVPPPVQSALLEAWQQAEQRCQTLEDQLRQLRDHLDRKDVSTAFTATAPPVTTPPDKPSPVAPARDTKLSRGRRRRHHRTPEEKRARRKEKLAAAAKRYLFWPAIVVAIASIIWGMLRLLIPSY
jgi:hypothetical protein